MSCLENIFVAVPPYPMSLQSLTQSPSTFLHTLRISEIQQALGMRLYLSSKYTFCEILQFMSLFFLQRRISTMRNISMWNLVENYIALCLMQFSTLDFTMKYFYSYSLPKQVCVLNKGMTQSLNKQTANVDAWLTVYFMCLRVWISTFKNNLISGKLVVIICCCSLCM